MRRPVSCGSRDVKVPGRDLSTLEVAVSMVDGGVPALVAAVKATFGVLALITPLNLKCPPPGVRESAWDSVTVGQLTTGGPQ